MIERFLKQTKFTSVEDYNKNLEFIIPENFNFAYDVMDAWAAEAPEKLAILWTNDQGEELRTTFGQLKEQTDQAASYLQSLGIGKNDPVMLILKRRYEWWVVMLALHKLGAVVIPATHMLTKHDIVYRDTRASIKGIICVDDAYVMSQVEAALPESPTVKVLIKVEETSDTSVSSGTGNTSPWHSWQNEWQKAPKFVKPAFVNTNDDTMLMYVWGKFYGQWFAGATVFVFDHEKFNADTLLRQIEKYKVTSFCAPPTIYRFMIREDRSKYDLSSLEYCTTAGEALNPAVFDKFKEKTGIQMMEGFGQTETTMTLGTFPWMTPKPGSMGIPNAQYDIDLLRADGTPCEDGEKGEIVVRVGDRKPIGLFKYYYRDEELTREAWHDGIYHTGDMAWRDEDGYYWFEGRIDDVIKSSGYRIGPFEVESALMTHPAVVECAITGVPDDIRGMVVKATVVLGKEWKDKAGDDLIKELQQHVKKETAPYKYPRIIEFVDELPKTISGKIRRVEIRNKDSKK